jgi:iron complex transport system substrate-binding protein
MLVPKAWRLGAMRQSSRRRTCAVAIWIALVAPLLAPPSVAAEPAMRIVSINACADQLLLALGERARIAAVTRYVDEPSMSFYRERAAGIRRISGAAEEVLKLKPDLVLAGRFTRRETRARLAELGIPVALLRPARSLDDVRALMREVGGLVGRPDTAEARIAELDAALAGARRAAAGLRVLQLQRRGFVAGQGTLFDAVLAHLGGENATAALGQKSVRRLPTEALLKLAPDAVVVFETDMTAADQGAALLMHPALRRLLPPDRLLVLEMNTIVCGGPQNIAAIRALERALGGIEPRS